jgi:hypothetical protein
VALADGVRARRDFIANINHYTLAIKFLPDRTIEVSADETSGLIRNAKLVGTPR